MAGRYYKYWDGHGHTGAVITGADITGADITGAVITGAATAYNPLGNGGLAYVLIDSAFDFQ